MTDIDPHADIAITYSDDDDEHMFVQLPLAGLVEAPQVWCRRYEVLARAKQLKVNANHRTPGGPAPIWISLAVPIRTKADDIPQILDAARELITETDAMAQEHVVRSWWARQQA